ncbi:MAG: hypothetical protein Q8N30_17165 [Methylococcales bacterium]|nr:hypothetical protein [Methylococcales bacterium]
MNIAEYKLDLFREIDELSEDSLIEVKKLITQLKSKPSAVITPEQAEQLKIGREFMQEYQETFNALAK